jgi:hypothetical protein
MEPGIALMKIIVIATSPWSGKKGGKTLQSFGASLKVTTHVI